MRIIFFGTAEFAVPSLCSLAESRHSIVAVVTQPDRKKGRGLLVQPPPVKIAALKYNLVVHQPLDLAEPKLIDYLRSLEPEVFVVISYGQILKKEILSLPSFCAINLHGSLLPKYRGAAPINWAIICGEIKTGLTVIKMNEYIDKGDIVLQEEIDIEDDDTAVSLNQRLSVAGADLLLKAIELIEEGSVSFIAQDETNASYAPRLKKSDGLINWDSPAAEIQRRIRGLVPWPCAYTYYKGKLLKIWRGEVNPAPASRGGVKLGLSAEPGRILGVNLKEGILVATGKDNLLIKELQLEGAKRMSSKQFIIGHKIDLGYKLG
jgi:methionyl-tRNA formyltransferase